MKKLYVYAVQVLFVCSIAVGSGILNGEDKPKWLNIARCLVYLLTIKSIPQVCLQILSYQQTGALDLGKVSQDLALYVASVALLVYSEQSIFGSDFVFVAAAYLILEYPRMATKQEISYGVGMACSFFEGYLVHIIPSDGAKFVGFEENIKILESREGVLFPVKKLFIIITKSLYSPPDLKEFNKSADASYIESFNYLNDVQKSVAGVKDRIYRNTAYKVYRGAGAGGAAVGVPLVAECATPLHTLHRVLNNRAVYEEAAGMDVSRVVEDFCRTLRALVHKSPQCRGKCELVYYDDEDPEQNLADILLDRIRELVPDYEEKILARRQQNIIED